MYSLSLDDKINLKLSVKICRIILAILERILKMDLGYEQKISIHFND